MNCLTTAREPGKMFRADGRPRSVSTAIGSATTAAPRTTGQSSISATNYVRFARSSVRATSSQWSLDAVWSVPPGRLHEKRPLRTYVSNYNCSKRLGDKTNLEVSSAKYSSLLVFNEQPSCLWHPISDSDEFQLLLLIGCLDARLRHSSNTKTFGCTEHTRKHLRRTSFMRESDPQIHMNRPPCSRHYQNISNSI